jgi:hypothetical protein
LRLLGFVKIPALPLFLAAFALAGHGVKSIISIDKNNPSHYS